MGLWGSSITFDTTSFIYHMQKDALVIRHERNILKIARAAEQIQCRLNAHLG